MRRLLTGVGVALMVGGWGGITPAHAAFPAALNGRVAFVSTRTSAIHPGGSHNIWTVNPNGATSTPDTGGVRQLTATSGDDDAPFYSPDGSQLVFMRVGGSTGRGLSDIYIVGANDTPGPGVNVDTAQALTHNNDPNNLSPHDDKYPSYSPDGHTVVFVRDNASLWTVDLSNMAAGPHHLLDDPNGSIADTRPVFDPVPADPSALTYVGGNHHLMKADLSGVNPVISDLSTAAGLTVGQDDHPDWAPDASQIILDSTRPLPGTTTPTANHQLWIIRLASLGSGAKTVFFDPNGNPVNTTASDTEPVFSPDGNYISWARPGVSKDVADTTVVHDFMHNGWIRATYDPNQGNANFTDLTLDPNNPRDDQPDWSPNIQNAVVPEAPMAIVLPASGLLLIGGAQIVGRRRRRARVLA